MSRWAWQAGADLCLLRSVPVGLLPARADKNWVAHTSRRLLSRCMRPFAGALPNGAHTCRQKTSARMRHPYKLMEIAFSTLRVREATLLGRMADPQSRFAAANLADIKNRMSAPAACTKCE
jgi:hypothetical protein